MLHEPKSELRRKHRELLRCLQHYTIQLGNLCCSQVLCIFYSTADFKIYGAVQLLSNATVTFFSSFPLYLVFNKERKLNTNSRETGNEKVSVTKTTLIHLWLNILCMFNY